LLQKDLAAFAAFIDDLVFFIDEEVLMEIAEGVVNEILKIDVD
jgi:hypothetical protein